MRRGLHGKQTHSFSGLLKSSSCMTKELGKMSRRSLLNVVFPLEEAPLTPTIIAFLGGCAITADCLSLWPGRAAMVFELFRIRT